MAFATPTKSMPAAASISAVLQSSQQQAPRSQKISISLPWEVSFGEEKLSFIVPDVLSEDECNAIIQNCENQGFEEALLNVGHGRQVLATDVRKSGRCIIDDELAAELLWKRLQNLLPGEITPKNNKHDNTGAISIY